MVRELERVGKEWESTASWDSEIESESWPPQEGQGEGPGRPEASPMLSYLLTNLRSASPGSPTSWIRGWGIP